MKKHVFELAGHILALPRVAKRLVALFVDCSLCSLSVWLAFYLRLGEPPPFSGPVFWAVCASIIIAVPVFNACGLYRAIFRYSGWPALLAVGHAMGIYGLVYGFIFAVIGIADVPRTLGIIQPILLFLFVASSRVLARVWLGNYYQYFFRFSSRPRVLIYGAGDSGRQLVSAIASSHEMQVVGFIDDDECLHGHVLNGQPIFSPSDLANLIRKLDISYVLLAMPNLKRKRRNEILAQIQKERVAVRTLPSFSNLLEGKISISDLRELDVDDLLGREPVMPNQTLLLANVRSKVVMVTGAGGSIGSELCRQIITLGPSKLLLIEQNEFALYSIHMELEKRLAGQHVSLIPILASVQDYQRIYKILSIWRPDIVYHSAAYKHVPLVEHNLVEGIKNNVFGTLRIAKAVLENEISNFVLISTDKAVRPTNIMGASKRLAEITLQAMAKISTHTTFSIVRFGNVLGSSGSVVPKFRQQIREGSSITLTHPEITRYFMTIPEASQLVIQAGAMAQGGDVFILDMGEPVKIIDLARRIIELSGLSVRDEKNPDGDIEIEITGLRPGEKLYEELLIGKNPKPTAHPRIMRADEEFIFWEKLETELNKLEMMLDADNPCKVREMIRDLVSDYVPSDKIVDWIHLEQEIEVLASK